MSDLGVVVIKEYRYLSIEKKKRRKCLISANGEKIL